MSQTGTQLLEEGRVLLLSAPVDHLNNAGKQLVKSWSETINSAEIVQTMADCQRGNLASPSVLDVMQNMAMVAAMMESKQT